MTSNLSTVFLANKSGMAAQELIKQQGVILKNGMLRKKGKFHFRKWPHRFVVLTNDSIFVYANETSKSPKSRFSLEGYNRVNRFECKGHDWCFSILPANSEESAKIKTFACFSDADRKTWMRAIKKQIYVANNISQPVFTVLDQIKLMAVSNNDEDDYTEIEHVVYGASEDAAKWQDSKEDNDDDDYDDYEDSDSSGQSDREEHTPVYKTKRSQSLPTHSLYAPEDTKLLERKFSIVSGKPFSSEDENYNDHFLIKNTLPHTTKRLTSDPLPAIPCNFSRESSEETLPPDSISAQSPPPRYSEVYRVGEEEFNDEHVYANLPKCEDDDQELLEAPLPPSLESLCTITDIYFDREQLNALLKAKKEPGTYLIRKSRTDSRKVIAVLNSEREVTELKIFGTPDNLTLCNNTYFTCIEALLQHYTSVQPLPKINIFLRRGFHQAKVDLSQ